MVENIMTFRFLKAHGGGSMGFAYCGLKPIKAPALSSLARFVSDSHVVTCRALHYSSGA